MRSTDNFDWDEAAEDTLRSMWAAGYSSTEIGNVLGINRDCVIGKRNRLKLPTRSPTPYKRKVSAHRRHKVPAAPPPKPIAEIPGWPTKAQLMAGR